MSLYQIPLEALEILSVLRTPISRDAFMRRYAANASSAALPLAEIWTALECSGLLREVTPTEQPTDIAVAHSGWRSHRGLLADAARLRAFEHAIAVLVRPGDRVIDVGAGSGILSLFAARAGAAQVDALEATAIIGDASDIAAANGVADRIQFIAGDAAAFLSAAPADLVMAECAGMYLLEEWRHFDAFAKVRDRNLKPGGIVVPARMRLYLSPVDDSRLYIERGPGFWERPVAGFDFRLVHERQLDRTRRIIVQAAKHTLLGSAEILAVDCSSADSQVFFFAHQFARTFSHDGTCHGFIGHFELELAPGIVLDTSPFSPDTNWHQSYFPIEAMPFRRSDTLVVAVAATPDEFTASPVLGIRAELRRGGEIAAVQERRYTLEDTQG